MWFLLITIWLHSTSQLRLWYIKKIHCNSSFRYIFLLHESCCERARYIWKCSSVYLCIHTHSLTLPAYTNIPVSQGSVNKQEYILSNYHSSKLLMRIKKQKNVLLTRSNGFGSKFNPIFFKVNALRTVLSLH